MKHEVRWTARKIGQRIELVESLVYRRRHPIPAFRYLPLSGPEEAPPVSPGIDDSGWELVPPESYWGAWLTDFVLRSQFQLPVDWDRSLPTALYLPLGDAGDFSHPETLAYIDGTPYAAGDRHHQEILLPGQWLDGSAHTLALHGWTGLGGFRRSEPLTKLWMRPCQLVQIDQPARDFAITARVAHGIAVALDKNDPAHSRLLNALDDAFKLVDIRQPFGDAFYQSIPAAHACLKAGIEKAGPSLEVGLVASGHAHIDVAWLWTLAQTRRKSGRTFHNVMRLMEQFPDYHFTQSQPQLYAYLEQDYPELHQAIKQRVAEGRWEPIGGMWVEADCNLSGAESLARQFLLGRTYFREQFGPDAESPVLWLPDVFGYAWALPQLIKQAGLDYFMTIKIGWSMYNRLPFDSFWWQGLDGTKVLTHFSTVPEPGSQYASTYNANADPAQVLGTWNNFLQKELPQDLLMSFGFGDGGGGPTREMLENIREMADFPATPRMRQGSVGDFFKGLEASSGDQLPVWNGELYLEIHRGTYTTQSRSKRANRKSEFLLHDAEFLASLATLLDAGYQYPAAAFREAWQLVCLNQFHDIIPGSSITPVYVESMQQYGQIKQMGETARQAALHAIAAKLGGDLLLANPISAGRSDLAFWPGTLPQGRSLRRTDGSLVPTQAVSGGTLLAAGDMGPYSIQSLAFAPEEGQPQVTSLEAGPYRLENSFVRVRLNRDGDICSIFDKRQGREVLAPGSVANQFQAFEDRPVSWDAWDVDIFYDDKMWTAEPADSVTLVESGPLRATIEIRRRLLNSRYVQRLSLCCNSPQIDFDTWIDWQEKHVLLKAAFPVDVLAPAATYEIQWGNTQRPTHHNTSWDWARFETCAQKWVDLSEGDYGVSLLNDCKYGHDIKDNVIRISLLRSPTMPDPVADEGEHRFAYSLLPHAGGWGAQTIAAAYALNDPIIAVDGPGGPAAVMPSLVSADRDNVIIETIKRAEDGNGIIIRLYESQRQRGPVTLQCSFPLAEAWQTNLLEDNEEQLPAEGHQLSLSLTPYQIVTLRLVPALLD